ncbi:MAG: tetratricopeptide repeat protein, partial [Myxococcota bacterium]
VEKYLELVSRDKEKKYTSKALFNASVAYEFMNKFDSATKLYEQVYRDYPDDPLSSYALYRVAVNAERFFEYDKAVTNYIVFYERFGKSPTPEALSGLDFNYDDRAQASLLNAAVLLKDQQKYRDAAQRFEEFERVYPSNENADDAAWEAVLAWEKAGRKRDMNKAIDAFIARHGSSANNFKVFQGLDKQLEYAIERKAKKTERQLYERMLSEYVARAIQPGTREAYFAAKAQFMLTEVEFEKWDDIEIKGNLDKQKKALVAKKDGLSMVIAQYDAVVVYGNLEYIMAAFFRQGYMHQRFASALYDAPVPFPEGSEAWDIYRQQLDDFAIPYEDKAIADYEEIVKQAREKKVVNEWTKRTLEELNKYRPAEYPLYKEERRATVQTSSSGQPLLDAAGAKTVTGKAPKAPASK